MQNELKSINDIYLDELSPIVSSCQAQSTLNRVIRLILNYKLILLFHIYAYEFLIS